MTRFLVFAGAAFLAAPVLAQTIDIPVRIEPPQTVKAIVLQTTNGPQSIEIRNGRVQVQSDLPLPWTVSSARFEATTYSKSDLEQRRPLVLRELGELRGTLQRPNSASEEKYTLVLRRIGNSTADEFPFVANGPGRFDVRVAAGQYEGIAIGELSGTRIRSGIVVAPGRMTDLGTLLCEPTVRVSIHVVDSKGRRPVGQARIGWDPPDVFNANSARILYSRLWSGVSDSHGNLTLSAVGPVPVALRWRVEAPGYAATRSRSLEVRDVKPVAVPDVELQLEAAITVRVTLPHDLGELKDATIVLASLDEENSLKFKPTKSRVALREGELKFRSDTYGKKRLIVNALSGKPLLYRDFDVVSENTIVDLAPSPSEVYGTATRRGDRAEGVYVRLADPHDASVVLAMTKTDAEGSYRLHTFQSGHVYVYAIPSASEGRSSGLISKYVDLGAEPSARVDFDFSGAGGSIKVVDAAGGFPLRASVDKRLEFKGGGGNQGMAETDKDGRLTFDSFPEGTAHLTINAKGYRAKTVDLPLSADAAEMVVSLEKSATVTGRIVDANGAAVPRARISGGYSSELVQPLYATMSDDDGLFQFESAPEIGTLFYVAAPRHALAITHLEPGQPNVVTLQPPGRGSVVFLPNNAPPTRLYMVMAAPAGGEFIPLAVLQDLGEVNGLSAFQLLGTARDGGVVLPQFLGAGTYNLYITLKKTGGSVYEKIGTIGVPADKNVVLSHDIH